MPGISVVMSLVILVLLTLVHASALPTCVLAYLEVSLSSITLVLVVPAVFCLHLLSVDHLTPVSLAAGRACLYINLASVHSLKGDVERAKRCLQQVRPCVVYFCTCGLAVHAKIILARPLISVHVYACL